MAAEMELGERELKTIGEYVKSHLKEWMHSEDLSHSQPKADYFTAEAGYALTERVVRVEEAIKHQNEKFDIMMNSMAEGFKHFDKRFELMQKNFDLLAESVDKRFEQVDKRFEQVDKRFEQVDKRFDQVDKRFDQVDERFKSLTKQMTLSTVLLSFFFVALGTITTILSM